MTLPMSRPAPRLPGVYVETVRPPRTDALPRMDIAGFVGFAASGPLDRPVPVEDLARFREVFGPDLILARDEARETDQRSLLGPAVESFFANGGRRAFVVRVADGAQVVTLDMPIPQLVDTDGVAAQARARSPGLWPAELATDTRLVRRAASVAPGAGLVSDGAELSMRLAPGLEPPIPGDLIELGFDGEGLIALMVVQRVEAGTTIVARADQTFWRRPSGPMTGALGIDDEGLVAVPDTDAGVTSLLAGSPPPRPSSASILTFDLLVWRGARIATRLDRLGFAPAHPRYWANLPDDATLYGEIFGRPVSRQTPEAARFEAEASAPRFPLAGPQGPQGADLIWLPEGMKTFADRARARAPAPVSGPRLEAEGLATFTDALFLDERFARLTTGALGPELQARYAMELGADAAPLRGLHALAPIGEVAMIAVPDAVHKPWSRRIDSAGDPLTAPFLDPIPRSLDAFGRIVLTWSAVPDAARYRVELAPDTRFANPQVVTTDGTSARIEMETDCPAPRAARVRAERLGEVGPWSNIRQSLVPEEDFEACSYTDPDLLTLRLALIESGSPAPRLSWAIEPPGAAEPGDRYEVQAGSAPGVEDGRSVATLTDETEYVPGDTISGPTYLRVRLIRGETTGPWSNTVRLTAAGVGDYVLDPDDSYTSGTPSGEGILTAIHRGMIRFAAARADLVSLLSVPRHYRQAELEAHLARLSPFIDDIDGTDDDPAGARLVPGLRIGEEGALSYAALQHPWFSSLSESNTAFQPPDGAIAGLLARQANGPGPWIAAANLPVAGTVALSPRFDDATQARLIARQTNPMRRDPRGFLLFNAETLSVTDDLRPLPVRLLMILIRRLALREGAAYVFEPHSADFRAQVRRRFETRLSLIHERGGFAGATPAQSFQVIADETNNPMSAVDQGRFTVELRVAPSRPMRYLNVRLLRSGTEGLRVEEAT